MSLLIIKKKTRPSHQVFLQPSTASTASAVAGVAGPAAAGVAASSPPDAAAGAGYIHRQTVETILRSQMGAQPHQQHYASKQVRYQLDETEPDCLFGCWLFVFVLFFLRSPTTEC